MKINVSRQNIYFLVLLLILLVFALLFSFLVLIPKGKEYRQQRIELKKDNYELKRYKNYNETVLQKLKKLQTKHRHIITAFDSSFNAQRFEKQNRGYFTSLSVSERMKGENDDEFSVYEVNTTSSINSPKSFYDFLDAINKGSWIIGVNFPIHFKREGEMIRSSFTMKIYKVAKN